MRAVRSCEAVTIRVSVRAEGGSIHPAVMAAQDHELLAGRGIPDARGLVARRRDDARPVGAEGGGADDIGMPAQDRDLLAGGRIPDARGACPRTR